MAAPAGAAETDSALMDLLVAELPQRLPLPGGLEKEVTLRRDNTGSELGFSLTRALGVTGVIAGSPADRAGLVNDARIVRLGQRLLEGVSSTDLAPAVKGSAESQLTIWVPDVTYSIRGDVLLVERHTKGASLGLKFVGRTLTACVSPILVGRQLLSVNGTSSSTAQDVRRLCKDGNRFEFAFEPVAGSDIREATKPAKASASPPPATKAKPPVTPPRQPVTPPRQPPKSAVPPPTQPAKPEASPPRPASGVKAASSDGAGTGASVLKVRKEPNEKIGGRFHGMELRSVDATGPLGRAGGARFEGCRVVSVNGKMIKGFPDLKSAISATDLEFEFGPPPAKRRRT
eukprot:Hpha_TRINITY_DN18891_c0_g1::TRINITY_DN18891_c0_g1_i1::g.26293::m.26293